MKSIFIGMLLVFLNFNLDINAMRIGLIPTFLGYIFMLKGLSELTEYSGQFSRVMPHTKVMIAYSAICYALDLFGISSSLGAPVSFVLGLVSTIVSLFISYGIIMGIKDIETTRVQNLNSEQLYTTWKLLATFSLIVYLLYLIPTLAIVCIIIGFIIGVYYLYIFSKTKNLFYDANPGL